MLSLHAAHQAKMWFPFGEGNRQCIGMPLARVNVQASVASLLSTFKYGLGDEVSHDCLTTDNQAHCRAFQMTPTPCGSWVLYGRVILERLVMHCRAASRP